jgi:hypothetical protein
MAANIDQVLEKVQKLLNVEGRTPEEAAAYVEKAAEILAQYDMTIEDVGQLKADPRTSVAKGDVLAKKTRGKADGWKADLLVTVARHFDARVTVTYEVEMTKSGRQRSVQHYRLIGFKHDLDAARYAFSFLVHEIERLGKEYARPMWDEIKGNAKSWGVSVHEAEADYVRWNGTHPLKAELYFVRGATETVVEALRSDRARREEARRADPNPNALVVQKEAEIADFIGRDAYGDRWEEVKRQRADWKVRAQEQEAARVAREAEERATETPAARARREARERKEAAKEAKRQARASEAYWRRYEREQAKIDHSALNAGQRAGRTISIRPGIKEA